jgi:O-antigen/teichoic acid export membrane protein
MRLPRQLLSLATLGLRTSTLALRFLLSFYIIKYLGYDAAGVYGLTVGVVGLAPAIIGWGLNYFVSREVVGQAPQDAARRVKDRLFVTFSSLATATLAAALIASFFSQRISHLYLLIAILGWLETLALDLYMPLVGLERALEVNVLVFVRSALWVPVVVAVGLLLPRFQTIETVLLAWIVANLVALGIVLYIARHWRLREALFAPIDFDWIRSRLSRSWYIYLSDLGIVGLVYIDRYIVSFMLGLTATGIYTFFWSLSNSLQTLVFSVVVQLALPALVKTFPIGDRSAWRAALRRELLKTILLSIGLAVAIYVTSEILLGFLSMQTLREHRGLFLLMLGGAVLRSCSDLANVAITSTGSDGFYAVTNILGVFLSIALSFVGVYAFGLEGAAIASLLTAAVLFSVRFYYLSRAFRTTKPATAIAMRQD